MSGPDINDHLVLVGNMGRYQGKNLIICGALAALIMMQIYLPILNHLEIPFRCDAEDQYMNTSIEVLMPAFPFDNKCTYDRLTDEGNITEVKCEKFKFAFAPTMTSIVSEFNLVCDHKYLPTLINILWMTCEGVGGMIGSLLTDRCGRKPMMIGSFFAMTVFGSITAASVHEAMYAVLRCITAITNYSAFIAVFAIVIESFAPNKRSQTANILGLVWVFGGCNLAWLAYLLPNWKHLQLTCSLIALPFAIASIWLVDETPHWLFTNGKKKEAFQVLQKMARWNRVEVPELDKQVAMMSNNEESPEKEELSVQTDEKDEEKESCFQLFRHLRVFARFVIFSIGWVTCALAYYGLSFGVAQLPGNLYLNIFLMNAVEAISYLGCFCIAWWGRKYPAVASYLLTAIVLFIDVFMLVYFPGSVSITVLSFLGKLFVSAAWQIMVIWQGEIYPTTHRCVLLGVNTVFGRIGIIVAPYLVDLHKYSDLTNAIAIAPSLFVVLMVICGFLHLMLPESNNIKIPETYEEANVASFPLAKEVSESGETTEDETPLAETKIDA